MSARTIWLRSLIACVLLVASGAAATEDGSATVAIRIEILDRSELESLTRLVSIEDVRGRSVRATATPRQLERLRAAGWEWRVIAEATATDAVMCGAGWVANDDRSWTCYPSYQQYEALMFKFADDHPSVCRLVDLGPGANTVRPHRLWAVIISDTPDVEEDEPEVLLTSTIHGDETTGYALTLRFIDHLLRGYTTDPEITALIDETEIWINPLANPDGTYFGGDHTVAGAIRSFTTAQGEDSGVDGNRNFPDIGGEEHPDGNPWWPETEAMMALAATRTFVLSVNFHDGIEVVNYPWDTYERRHPDDLWFRTLARDWADLAQADGPAGYMTDLDNGITNGYDWYPIAGGRQDYVTFFHGGREVTIELSREKLPPAEDLDNFWLWNRRALVDFIAHAHSGIRGVVSDRDGSPLSATITVLGVDRVEDGSIVRTDPAVGDYNRLLLPGLYDLRIEAEGYFPEEVRGVAVSDGEATVVDVVLHPAVVRRPVRRVLSAPASAKNRP